jgi:hypothetical protein
MAVDWARRFYRTTMRLWDDPAAPPVPVRWFRAAPDAKWLPVPTFANDRRNERDGKLGDDTPLPFLGETRFGGPYDRGLNRPVFLGQDYHGDPAVWARGGRPGIDPAFVTDGNGALPGCIAIVPFALEFRVSVDATGGGPAAAGQQVAVHLVVGAGAQEATLATAAQGLPLALVAAAAASQAGRGDLHATAAIAAAFQPREAQGQRFAPLFAVIAAFAPTTTGEGVYDMVIGLKALLVGLSEGEANVLVALALKARGEGLSAAEAAVAEHLALKAGVQVPGTGIGSSGPAGAGKLSVSMTMAAITLQPQPIGTCSAQLPNQVVIRFSGGTGTGTAMNGASATCTYAVGAGWSGTFAAGGHSYNVGFQCPGPLGSTVGINGSGIVGSGNLTGTGGASPNMTGTITFSVGGPGSIVGTITRT